MRRNKQIVLSVLVTLALVSLALSAGLGRNRERLVACVAAREAIAAGSILKEEQLTTIMLPADMAAACYLTQTSLAVGCRTSCDLLPGELVGSHHLGDPAEGIQYPGAGSGRRLLTIRLDPAEANGFWLAAGNRVDLYLVPRSRENGLETEVMESIEIAAVLGGQDQDGAFGASSDPLLCLDLSIDQVRRLYNAYGVFDLHAAVVNECRPASSAGEKAG